MLHRIPRLSRSCLCLHARTLTENASLLPDEPSMFLKLSTERALDFKTPISSAPAWDRSLKF